MMTNTNTASFIRLTFAAVTACLITTACSTGVPIQLTAPTTAPPPSLKNMPPPDAVLELIQRVMKAAKTGVLINEEAALKTLGLTMVPSTKPGITRKIITGIAALDDDEEVRVYYGVNRNPALPQTWGFSIRSISQLVCIDYSSATSKLGAPQSTVFPLHGQGSGGSYLYFIYAETEKIEASLIYARVGESKRCLNDVSIRPIKQ